MGWELTPEVGWYGVAHDALGWDWDLSLSPCLRSPGGLRSPFLPTSYHARRLHHSIWGTIRLRIG